MMRDVEQHDVLVLPRIPADLHYVEADEADAIVARFEQGVAVLRWIDRGVGKRAQSGPGYPVAVLVCASRQENVTRE